MTISTSVWSAQHTNAGLNMQQPTTASQAVIPGKTKFFVKIWIVLKKGSICSIFSRLGNTAKETPPAHFYSCFVTFWIQNKVLLSCFVLCCKQKSQQPHRGRELIMANKVSDMNTLVDS